MSDFEYKIVAAPTRGIKAKGAKTAEARFSSAIEQLMNDMASEGWEYQRAETLPSIERSGLTSTKTHWRNILVFRRRRETAAPSGAKPAAPAADAPKPETRTEPSLPPIIAPKTAEDDASLSAGASRMLRDNGVEQISEVAGMTRAPSDLAAARKQDKSKD